MHEMALAEAILAVVRDVAQDHRVRCVRLRVGALQQVVPDTLRFCFLLAAQDTPAAAAHLELQEVPARLRCQRCGAEETAQALVLLCPRCGASEVQLIAGDELLVDGVELEDGWRYRPGAEPDEAARLKRALDHHQHG